MSEQSCGTCKHWTEMESVVNQWTKHLVMLGECGAPMPDSSDHNPYSAMASTEGKECPCYQSVTQ
jgi:hypothetical protein